MTKIRIGYNPAANMLPIFYFLNRENPNLQFHTGYPAHHNALLAEGSIDMAPISAFSFGQHWPNYSVLADLSVSAKGPIGSILLYSKYPLTELNGRTIALTNTSASSVNLLKIILTRFYSVNPVYISLDPDLDKMLQSADAALLIADEALMGLSKNTGCYVYDLSAEWHKHTGLSMTFSVWAVRKQAIENHPEQVAIVHNLLLKSKQLGAQHKDKIIDYCISTLGENHEFWSTYFSQLRHGLEPDLVEGLTTYFRYCVELGLLPSQPQIDIWPSGR